MRAKLQSMRFIARVLVEHCPLERAAWQTHEASEPTCFCHRPDEDADVRWLAWLARHDLTSAKVPGFTARIIDACLRLDCEHDDANCKRREMAQLRAQNRRREHHG
jgi:hypothetical protein